MAKRKKIIAANWKMNMTVAEAGQFLDVFLREVGNEDAVDIVLVPPFTALSKVSERLTHVLNVRLGAQNLFWEKPGAFTGEICAPMLRELFVRYVVIGHSERRQYFGETDATVNRRVKAALEGQIKAIVCVGETLEQRDGGKVEQVLDTQLRGGLAGLEKDAFEDIVIAYEPVWAIGTGRTATPQQAQETQAFVRKTIASIAGDTVAKKIRIQYGGSVKPANAAELMSQPDIDGALVGGASLDARGFADIVNAAAELAK